MIHLHEILWEIEIKAVRSRGPGGQNVNKVSSAAQIFWNFKESARLTLEQKVKISQRIPTMINNRGEIYLRCDEFRDLERNRTRALEKLLALVNQALKDPKKRKPTRPTRASKLKKQTTKVHSSLKKQNRSKIRMDR